MVRLTDGRVAAIIPPATGQVEHADDLVRGLRLRVGAGGRKSWIVRARAGAKVLNKTLGRYPVLSLAKARQEARTLLISVAGNGAPHIERTFDDLALDWIARVAKPNNRSWRLQERRLALHVLPAWKGRKLSDIRRRDVRDLVESIEGEVLPNRVLTLVRTLFRHARSRDWLDVSPAEGIAKPKAEASRDRVLDMHEVVRVFRAADLIGYPFGGFIKLLVLTGQRRTEVAAMRWNDIDLEASLWTIPAEANKSGRVHVVPLCDSSVRILQNAPRLGQYVWSDNGRTHISGYSKAKARLDNFLSARGYPVIPWVFHDLRRTMATHMVRLGVTELIVGRVLNHAVTSITGRVYTRHAYVQEKRAALDKWEADLLREMSVATSEN